MTATNRIDNLGGVIPPIEGHVESRREHHVKNDSYLFEGMTLRDYFAARAMQGILAGWDTSQAAGRSVFSPDAVANRAYTMADFMLKARKQ